MFSSIFFVVACMVGMFVRLCFCLYVCVVSCSEGHSHALAPLSHYCAREHTHKPVFCFFFNVTIQEVNSFSGFIRFHTLNSIHDHICNPRVSLCRDLNRNNITRITKVDFSGIKNLRILWVWLFSLKTLWLETIACWFYYSGDVQPSSSASSNRVHVQIHLASKILFQFYPKPLIFLLRSFAPVSLWSVDQNGTNCLRSLM